MQLVSTIPEKCDIFPSCFLNLHFISCKNCSLQPHFFGFSQENRGCMLGSFFIREKLRLFRSEYEAADPSVRYYSAHCSFFEGRYLTNRMIKFLANPFLFLSCEKFRSNFKKIRKIPFGCKSAPFFGGGPCKPFDIHEILLIVSHAASDDGDRGRAELIQCFSLFLFSQPNL